MNSPRPHLAARLRSLLSVCLLMTAASLPNDSQAGNTTSEAKVDSGEHVILLHGLARSTRCMRPMQRALQAKGYTVHNVGYPSRKHLAEQLVTDHIAPAIDTVRAAGATRIHIVAHSLGGILTRLYAETHDFPDAGRLIMLGPPNGGSEVVDSLGHLSLYRWINGPAGTQLGTDPESLPSTLGPAKIETGIIAGNRSINVILSRFIKGTDDGKVSIENTHLEGATDHITIPCSHPYLMTSRQSIQLVKNFLATGKFGESE